MTKARTDDEIDAGREARRFKEDQKAWDRMGRKMGGADALIGELIGGNFYVNQRNKAGRLTGKAVIFRNRQDAFDYLLRNRYV